MFKVGDRVRIKQIKIDGTLGEYRVENSNGFFELKGYAKHGWISRHSPTHDTGTIVVICEGGYGVEWETVDRANEGTVMCLGFTEDALELVESVTETYGTLF